MDGCKVAGNWAGFHFLCQLKSLWNISAYRLSVSILLRRNAAFQNVKLGLNIGTTKSARQHFSSLCFFYPLLAWFFPHNSPQKFFIFRYIV
jgi:hypothetical protein